MDYGTGSSLTTPSIATTNSLAEFHAWASSFARALRGDEIILLSGPMGAGKTEFVKVVAGVLGAREGVSSPTYAFHQQYDLPSGKLEHWDLDRVKSVEDLDSIGFWGQIMNATGIVCVEWPERAESSAWPIGKRIVRVTLTPSGPHREVRAE